MDARPAARQHRSQEPDGSGRDEVPLARHLAEAQPGGHARAGPDPRTICRSTNLPVPAPRPLGRKDRPPVLLQREDLFPLLPLSQPRPERRRFRQARNSTPAGKSLRPTTSTASSISPPSSRPCMFNEFRVGYNRRATSNPPRPDAAKYGLGIPGVGTETFPYFNIGYSIARDGHQPRMSARTGCSRTT